MNVLALGAHPDDIELGCGGLLIKAARQGHNVWMYTLTRGAASGDPNERTKEQIESAKFIGAKTMWIDNFEDTKVPMNIDLIRRIEAAISYSHADVVYTHPLRDTHHDHRAIAEATLEAGRFVPNILSYEMPVTKDFNPQVYYDISDVINDKIELLSIFSSQRHKMFICSNATRGLAQYRALQSRLHPLVTSVEAYEVLRLGVGSDFSLLTSNNNLTKVPADYKIPFSNEILEWSTIEEKPILNR
jgi:LmbE family N-acetylglucosaminyl deacetylase